MKAQAASSPSLPIALPRIVEEISAISERHDELVSAILEAETLQDAQVAAEKLKTLGKQIEDLLSELKEPGHKGQDREEGTGRARRAAEGT